MDQLLQTALSYAARGWLVFPLHGSINGRCSCGRADCASKGKHPLVKRGLHEATTDESQINEWWRRRPHANVAITTGERSGIVVIDIDLPRALPSLEVLLDKLPRTLTALTGGGGVHLIYRAENAGLRCTTSRVPGIPGELPGIDIRADGGYIVAPPSVHASGQCYTWLDPTIEIAPIPTWMKESPRRSQPIEVHPPRYVDGAAGTERGLRLLDKQLSTLRAAADGTRNHTLNRCAFIVACAVARGDLADGTSRYQLEQTALTIGLSSWETHRTVDSAFSATRREPSLRLGKLSSEQ